MILMISFYQVYLLLELDIYFCLSSEFFFKRSLKIFIKINCIFYQFCFGFTENEILYNKITRSSSANSATHLSLRSHFMEKLN